MKKLLLAVSFLTLVGFALAQIPRTERPKDAEVYFIAPKDGAVIKGDVTVKMGLKGMGVAPAGIKKENTGHHHILVNKPLSEVNMGLPIPNDATHVHFGGGQTETVLKLKPGKHTLQLLLGDDLHVPHKEPVVSKQITITVK